MSQKYNQLRAMLAVTKASLKATFRSPQSIFFSLFFPIVLIWIFGSIGGGSGIPSVDVALEKNADTANRFYSELKMNPTLHFVKDKNKDIEDELRKGRIAGVIDIQVNRDSSLHTPYLVHLRTSSASQRDFQQLKSSVNASIAEMDRHVYPERRTVASISESVGEGRKYRMIDFF